MKQTLCQQILHGFVNSERIEKRDARGLAALSIVILLTALFVLPETMLAQSTADEYQVKAGFLFHFAQLIDWPASSQDDNNSLLLCILGEDPFHGSFDAIKGKLIGTKVLYVSHFNRVRDVQHCQLLYISKSKNNHLDGLLSQLRTLPTVTVGESEEFLHAGGIIAFCLENNKVRFAINIEAAENAKLKISSRLLSLATNVIGSGRRR